MSNSNPSINISGLQGVSATLLVPFIARARAATLFPDLRFQDPIAESILPRLQIDQANLPLDTDSLRKNIVRGRIFDRQLRLFFDDYPDATVISLGAGLSTQFHRVDNGRVTWFDIDLPEVIKVKSLLLPHNDRYHLHGCSLTEPDWLDLVSVAPDTPVIIVCEGVLNFIEPTSVKAFFQMIAAHFKTQAHIVFDYVHPWLLRAANKSHYVRTTSADFRWGIRHIREVLSWSKRFELVDVFSVMAEVGGSRALMAMLFHRVTGSHLYAIAELRLRRDPNR